MKKIYYGQTPFFSISKFYSLNINYNLNKNYLITCLDSSTDLKELNKWIVYLRDKKYKFEFINGSVYISNDNGGRIFSEGKTFYGFDEVYILNSDLIYKKAPHNYYMSYAFDFNSELPKDFLEYFLKIDAETYLSDGTGFGLNFATYRKDLIVGIKTKVKEI